MAESQDLELDLIAVGAHPDDVEIACGGTLARLVRQGYAVGIVDLTDGEPTPHSPGPGRPAGRGAAGRRDPGGRDADQPEPAQPPAVRSFEARVALAKVFRRHRPKVVHRVRGQDRAGLARPLPGDADHRRGGLLQPADEVGRALRRPARLTRSHNQLSFPIALAWVGLARGVRLHCRRHRPDPGGQARGDPLLPDPVPRRARPGSSAPSRR